MSKKTIGIIAGKRDLPKILINDLERKNQEFYVAFIDHSPEFKIDNKKHITASIGEVSKILKFFKQKNVTHITLVGNVTKPSFSLLKTDLQGANLLLKITKNTLLGDNNLLTTIIKFLEQHKFTVISVDDLLPELHIGKGSNSEKIPNKSSLKDIEIGVTAIKKLSELDIGQSVALQNGRVIAVEASEGTDELIKRSSEFIDKTNKNPAILVKIAKSTQDLRIDLPTIGETTIKNLSNSGFGGIAIDTKNTIVLHQNKTLSLANKLGIFIYGV